ncbi:RNA dependent RNA polymerase [Clostridium sp. CTA-6]
MKSPQLFSLLKLKLQDFITSEKEKKINKKGITKVKTVYKLKDNIALSNEQFEEATIKQQYNHLFRILKNKNRIENNFIKDVLFIDCKNNSNYQKQLDGILKKGVFVNNIKYKYWGKSASMSRSGILGFVSEEMYDDIEEYAMMDIKFDKTILSKFEAYKCLLLSSCFCIEDELPYMIVVDDYETIVKDVNIRYVDEKEVNYIDNKTEEEKIFKEKIIKHGKKDINNCINDGAGFISKEYAKKISEYLGIEYTLCIAMLRIPYVKGLGIAMDFKSYYKSKGITHIKDIWGKEHRVEDIDIILTKSQYKGYKYFKQDNTYNDWKKYLKLLKKYNYCVGISKWNYSHETEPKMTRANYQTLQTLDITKDDLIEMSKYTRSWIEKILGGDLLYVYKYLGIGENTEPSNIYMKAIMLNPQMINDIKVRSYLYGLLKKTIDEIKIGKIYIKGAFKFLIPDVIMMLEYIGGLPIRGCLKEGEMYAKEHEGEYVLNRNPHICKAEHIILNAVSNDDTKTWLSHLENVCMVNGYDVTAQSLNGADYDGDLVFVHNNSIYIKGINRDSYIVLDIEDKITAKEQPYDKKHIIDFTKKSLSSRIGEISNCASTYHNKFAKDEETRKKYEDYTCLLSVINGKEIDYVKTGIRWNVPRNIAKGAKPLPYFLKYKYSDQNKHNRSKTKMNEHCWFIEKWERKLKFSKDFINTSYCMMNNNIPFDDNKYNKVVKLFELYKKEYKSNKNFENMCKNYEKYQYELEELDLNKKVIKDFEIDWDKFYKKYRIEFLEIVPNQSELANYLVELVYNKMNGMYYNQMWQIVKEGILTNLRINQIKPILVPEETKDNMGTEYLGRYYKFVEYKGCI